MFVKPKKIKVLIIIMTAYKENN